MIIPTAAAISRLEMAVPIERYFQIVGLSECAGMGVLRSDDNAPYCQAIWTRPMRQEIERYLLEAQEEIEQQLGFYLTPRYTVAEQHAYSRTVFTNWGYVIAMGIEAFETIAADVPVDHTSDPAIIGPLPTSATDINEIVIFHPNTTSVIIPSDVEIAGGQLTVEIPRCRLLIDDDNPTTGWDYNDLDLFEETVDIMRRYTDTTDPGEAVYYDPCSYAERTTAIRAYVRNNRLGVVDIFAYCPTTLQAVRLNYLSGMSVITRQMEDAVVRLAHSKMPEEVCSCAPAHNLWLRDQHVPEVLTRERLGCPFGLNDGAWIAWRFVQAARLVRGSNL